MILKKNKIALLLITIMSLVSFSNYTLKDIDVRQLSKIDESYIKDLLPIKIGDEYSNRKLSDIYLSLVSNQAINSVILEEIFNNEDVTLVIKVDEASNAQEILENEIKIKQAKQKTDLLIKSIKVNGIKDVDIRDILKNSNVQEGTYFTPYDVEILKEKIKASGYFKNVEVETIKSANDKSIDIVFNVEENPIVKSISVVGSYLYPENELIEASKIEEGKVLNLNYVNPETAPILDIYKDSGVISAGFSGANMDEQGNLTIRLVESTVGSITFQKKVNRKDGDRRNSSKYILKTRKYILDRQLKLAVGDVLTTDKVRESILDLNKTGLFTSINPVFKPNSSGTIDVIFEIEERPTSTINGSVSYTNTDGLVGEIKLSDSNFLGSSKDASIALSFNTKGNFSLRTNYFDPWIKGTDKLQAGVSTDISTRRTSSSDLSKLKDDAHNEIVSSRTYAGANKYLNRQALDISYGISATIGKALYKNTFLTIKPKINGVVSFNKEGQKLSDYTLMALTPSIIFDTRDNAFTPKKGFFLQVNEELGYIFRNDTNEYSQTSGTNVGEGVVNKTKTGSIGLYNKINVDFKFFHKLYKESNSMAYHLSLGYATKLAKETFSNIEGTIFRGHNGTLSGQEKATLSIENRTYISNYVQAVLFFDIGTIYESANRNTAWQFDNIVKTFGAGIRVNTPIGIIRLDYGWPIARSTVTNAYKIGNGKISFGFGHAF